MEGNISNPVDGDKAHQNGSETFYNMDRLEEELRTIPERVEQAVKYGTKNEAGEPGMYLMDGTFIKFKT